MGMAIEFGPPHPDLDPREDDIDDFFGDRVLTKGQVAELKRILEHEGFVLSPSTDEDGAFDIENGPETELGDWEYFAFGPNGGAVQNPSSEDHVLADVWDAVASICDYAGWIALNPAVGIEHGIEVRCPSCHGSLIEPGQNQCDEGHSIREATFEITVSPPTWPAD